MSLATYNDFLSRWCAGFGRRQPIWGEQQTTKAGPFNGASSNACVRFGRTRVMPGSLPSGVTAFIPTSFAHWSSSPSPVLAAKLIDLGSLSLAGPTFTDGSAMPTITECGVSRQIPSAVMAVVTTAFNALPGSFSITYTDQDGNTGNVLTSTALTASSTVDAAEIILLNTGDCGVIDITAATRTGGTTPTGVMKFYGMLPIAFANPAMPLNYAISDMITNQINPVRLGVDDEIGFFQLAHSNSFTGACSGILSLVGDN